MLSRRSPAAARDTPPQSPSTGRPTHDRLHLLLSLISLVVVLVSVNRKHSATLAPVADNGFLRWVEAGNMALGLCTVVLYHLVVTHLTNAAPHRGCGAGAAPGILLVTGAYLYALSLGDHEITNYRHGRFCSAISSSLCRVVAFNDDVFSDLLFLAGFTVLNVTVILTQVRHPSTRALRPWDNILIVVNALFVAAAITANLAFEKAQFDPFVVAATAALDVVLLARAPHQPMLRYYAVAYTGGIVASVLIRSR
ncbi:hypothetical protein GCM10010330_76420 [Streptomyces tendae]|uniref:hypothetical protein n=1 Tax=Streptomyces tendae TaxID=1932 RepID=UPI00167B0CF4|nr:hypothetical protein [Streptomyces tendae]GHB11174.1 hypothetical protein GCM10010330_76420 [Streptomyces tendae]